MCYDYSAMRNDIRKLTEKFNGVESFSIGKSLMDKDILCIKIGEGERKLFLSGAYHGLEYLTSAFLMRFAERYIKNIDEPRMKKLYQKVTLYIVPMVNPDGVDIAVNGLDITNPYHRRLISMVGIHSFNNVWQANARGVDINHNYDAKWNMVVENPAPSKYGGEYAESEPETQAVANFVREQSFDMLLAFHSQGEEIYYDFDGMTGKKSEEIAEKLAEESGYKVCRPTGTAAFGGCKDWFIKEFGREGFTVEIGRGKNPLPMKMLDDVYEENERLVLRAMAEL
ncbi:MAG: M14 family metallocarboxypeptidase [Oscillospiraceae bacterium]|nr:M14 family metallocarboxypeptidase [Oscillospiraceae bacterium]